MPWLDTQSAASPQDIFPCWFLAHWDRLSTRYGGADPFCSSPGWNLPYHHVVNPGRRLFYDASTSGAILFGEYFDSDGHRLIVPIEDSWLYGQSLLGPEAPFLLEESLRDLQEDRPSIIFVSGMLAESFPAFNLYHALSTKFRFYRKQADAQQSASLAGGVDGWLGRRSANTRANMRKALQKARNAGIDFERVRPDVSSAACVYERILAIERTSWKGLGHCGMLESPSMEFYRAMLLFLAASRSGLVIFASLDGEDVGFIFGALHGGYYRGQQFSYSEKYSRLSIGNLLQYHKIAWLSELGCERYDMGPASGKLMAYKCHWTEQQQEFQTWALVPQKA